MCWDGQWDADRSDAEERYGTEVKLGKGSPELNSRQH